jgi:hypothetical protein
MKTHLYVGAAAMALLIGASGAFAQTTNMQRNPAGAPMAAPGATQTPSKISLTAQQKQAIWTSVASDKGAKAPANFQASIGANVPADIALRPLPANVLQQVPDAKNYRYAKVSDQVLLVDPSTKVVVDIIKL